MAITFADFHDALTDKYEQRPDPITYTILGLGGETGEVIELYKKAMRVMRPENIHGATRAALLDELGDVLWYVARLAKHLDSSLEEVARINMVKLAVRDGRPTPA